MGFDTGPASLKGSIATIDLTRGSTRAGRTGSGAGHQPLGHPLSAKQAQLLLVLALGLPGQLLDAIERHLLGLDQRTLRLDRTNEALLDEVELADRLMRQGWVPRKHTEKGQPIVDEATLSVIDLPLAQKIARYLMLQKGVAQVSSWLDKVDRDSRVRCGYLTLGAITHRMSCTGPNLQQVPGPQSEYGMECRSCWTVPAGRQLIGTDLAGIELRCLAHYLNDNDYTEELINGDVHTRTQHLAGLPTRAGAKTFTYALLYGAGNAKLGTIIGGGADAGAAIRERYLRGMPSFANLQRRVARQAVSGTVTGIDGRHVRVRSEHAALNTLLQSCAAVIAKQWLINVHETLPPGPNILPMIHHELCIEADASLDPEEIGLISKNAVQAVAEQLSFNCPLDCDWKVGNNWSETH